MEDKPDAMVNITTAKHLNIDAKGINKNPSGGKQGLTSKMLLAIIVVTLGCSIPAGHNIGVINTPQEIMRTWVQGTLVEQYDVQLSPSQDVILWSVIVSIFVAGAAIGSMLGAYLANVTGRRRAILMVLVLNLLASIIFMCCKTVGSVEMLIMARLLAGIAAGLSTSLVPLYLSELAPKGLEGVMGVLLPFGMCAGLIISQIVGMDIAMGTDKLWPVLIGGFDVYVIIALILYPKIPESPVDHINLTGEEQPVKLTTTNQWNMKQVFASKDLHLPLLLVAMLHFTQQLSGINAVFYYSTIIFRTSGLTMAECQIAAICSGLFNWLMSALAFPLIRYCQRRKLILWSIILSIVSQVILMVALYLIPTTQSAGFVAIAALLGYVLAYGIGLGPVPFMMATELFPVGPRPVGLAVGGAVNWSSNLLVGLVFPILQQTVGEYSFCVFIAACFMSGIFFYIYLPETLIKEERTATVNNNVLSSEENTALEDAQFNII